jgi:hypothetical protein
MHDFKLEAVFGYCDLRKVGYSDLWSLYDVANLRR